jgi:hypothetical protein
MNSDDVEKLRKLIELNSSLLSREGIKNILNFTDKGNDYFVPISSLRGDGIFSFRGLISRGGETRVIPKGEKDLRLLKVEVSDGTGVIKINLWNTEIDYYQDKLKEGNTLEFIDCRLTTNSYGAQISLGDKGFIILEEEGQPK